MILASLEASGGMDYLMKQAADNPTAFMTLLGKVLPLQVTGENGGPLQIERIERVIIDPQNRDAARLPAPSAASKV